MAERLRSIIPAGSIVIISYRYLHFSLARSVSPLLVHLFFFFSFIHPTCAKRHQLLFFPSVLFFLHSDRGQMTTEPPTTRQSSDGRRFACISIFYFISDAERQNTENERASVEEKRMLEVWIRIFFPSSFVHSLWRARYMLTDGSSSGLLSLSLSLSFSLTISHSLTLSLCVERSIRACVCACFVFALWERDDAENCRATQKADLRATISLSLSLFSFFLSCSHSSWPFTPLLRWNRSSCVLSLYLHTYSWLALLGDSQQETAQESSSSPLCILHSSSAL